MAVMDTEEKIRIAIQVLVAVILWTWGFYKLALLETVVLLPWKPILEASDWLVEPIIKWRVSKSPERVEEVSRDGVPQVFAELEHSDA